MLTHFFWFEVRYWLRSIMLWVFLLVMGAMFFGAASTDQITVGQALENTYRNAPFVIQSFYSMACVLSLLMVTAFVNSAAARDFTCNTHQIVFSTPLRKFDYLMGRFLGASLISVIPVLGVSLGILLAKYMPWVDAERWGPVDWSAHGMGILVFAIPNTLFVSGIMFTIAALTRSTLTSFLAALLLLVGYGVSEALTSDLENETIAMLVDPFAARTFALMTKYWTVADKNANTLGFTGMMLWNRLLWLGVGFGILAAGLKWFSFTERSRRTKKRPPKADPAAPPVAAQAAVALSHGAVAQWAQLLGNVRVEFWGLVRSTAFLVLLAASLLNTVPSLLLTARQGYGTPSLPVTYLMIDIIRGSSYLFLIAILVYFAGVLVWKERDARADEIHDALPYPEWVSYASKLAALLGVLFLLLGTGILCGAAVQAYHNYQRFQPGLYGTELLLFDYLAFLHLAVLAFFVHVLSPNKYAGYFAYIVILIINVFIWRPLDVASNMVQFGETPSRVYSDFYLFGPYLEGLFWFHVYWLLFCGLLAVATVVFWPRGKETSAASRFRSARLNFLLSVRIAAGVIGLTWAASAAWVFYNTKVRNEIRTEKAGERIAGDYEKKYKKFLSLPQPRIQSVRYAIDVYPEQRNLILIGEQIIANKSARAIPEIHLTLDRGFETQVEIERASSKEDDKRLGYRIYSLNPPLQPGGALTMKFTVKSIRRGFENEVRHRNKVQNGTFFNNTIAPQIGYQPSLELTNRNDRKKQGLNEKDTMPALDPNCDANCRNTYISNNSDWVSVETVMSTSPDQIAVAPGSLVREWTENGRRYFHYRLDRDSLNFYSFISARYNVARADVNGLKSEVYYHSEHTWNVPKMQDSIRDTLAYCTRNFGPYAHKQARIIEFPRFGTFAQAFPGTMPYSEGIGFIADLKDPDDIDMVYYVVAHEMGHQLWAHQVIGADMQGATLLSETMSQYTALMVMEQRYGRDMMRKFLEYEMDGYLRSRGRELLKEKPLLTVESGQGYIHYRKGSVVLYYLKEMIGEEAVNRALRRMVEQFAYAPPPYPTSHHLVDALRRETPAELQYLIKDLFEEITLFSNRTLKASAVKSRDGRYTVTIDVESKKIRADEKGAEREVPLNDWIEIGAFAKPAKGKKYGATLHRQRVRVSAAKNTYTFTTVELPDKAGIDPFLLLVDRVPSDNVRTVTVN
jgi:ABC-type transport system involved in multi-copper enzyme maturation permease subunit